MRFGLGPLAVAIALALTVVGAVPAAAATNIVTNPNGAGGSTSGWKAGRAADTLTSVEVGGQSWLEWKTTQTAYDWTVYRFAPGTVNNGSEYTCGFEAMGSGTVYAMVYDGKNLNRETPKALTDTPQVYTESATIVNATASPEVEVRTNNGPADVYFNEVTCIPGSSVTIPLSTASLSSSGSTSSAATSTSSSVTSSSSSAASKASSTTSSKSTSTATSSTTGSSTLPSTGESPLVAVFGALLVGAGLWVAGRRAVLGR